MIKIGHINMGNIPIEEYKRLEHGQNVFFRTRDYMARAQNGQSYFYIVHLATRTKVYYNDGAYCSIFGKIMQNVYSPFVDYEAAVMAFDAFCHAYFWGRIDMIDHDILLYPSNERAEEIVEFFHRMGVDFDHSFSIHDYSYADPKGWEKKFINMTPGKSINKKRKIERGSKAYDLSYPDECLSDRALRIRNRLRDKVPDWWEVQRFMACDLRYLESEAYRKYKKELSNE